jgi:cell division protein FtsA
MQATSEVESIKSKRESVGDIWSRIHAWFKGEF